MRSEIVCAGEEEGMIKLNNSRFAMSGLAVLTAGMIFACGSLSAFATTGTVTSSNVKVRAEASTSSTQVSSLDSGDTVDIIEETKDSQGYVWYKIYVNGNETGYVRSDLVSASGSVSSASSAPAAESLPETSATAMDAQSATVTVESANVRSGAGTGYDTVGTVKNGDTVTVTGEADGTDSKKWYQISFGEGKTGYVRADLVQIGGPAPAEGEGGEAAVEGENPEGAEGEAVEGQETDPNANTEIPVDTSVGNGEFSLAYKADETGAEVWYLYDNVEGTQVKLNDLLTYAASGQQADQLKEQANKLKVVLIVMAIVIALLVLAVLLLIYKLRDYTYYEDEEPEDTKPKKRDRYDDLPAQKPARKPVDADQIDQPKSKGRVVADSKRTERTERTVTPTRERKSAPMGTAESLLGGMSMDREDKRSADRRPAQNGNAGAQAQPDARRAAKPAVQAPKKSRNFLLDDEDFEFEFLNLDDDDDK